MSSERWWLEGFLDRFATWIELEAPSVDLRLTVLNWIFTRFEDPYLGVRRAPGFDNLWFGQIPRTRHGDRQVVTCSYWIEELRHTVRCDSIATLSAPT